MLDGIGVFIELKKAFDSIDHKLLLTKLEHYGIRGVVYDWIKSYLCESKQYVSVNNGNSEAMNVVCGVPQGYILGPNLFILYMNYICNVSSLLRFVLFADDTNLLSSGDDVKEISKTLSKQLDKLNSWFAVNKLSLNVSKTNYMIFGNKKIDKYMNICVRINGLSIDRVYNTTFLGVMIDDKLNWKEHITMIQSNISKTTAIIYKASHVLPGNRKGSVYIILFISTSVYDLLRGNMGKHIQNQCVTCFPKAKKAIKNCL